jgi:hypothetical protein
VLILPLSERILTLSNEEKIIKSENYSKKIGRSGFSVLLIPKL